MKKAIYCVVVGALLAGLLLGCAPREVKVLKAVAFVPYDDPALMGYRHFEELVNERGKGKISIEFTGGPEAIGIFDQAPAVQSGMVDMCCIVPGYYSALVPLLGAIMYVEFDPMEQRKRGTHDFILEQHKKANLYWVGPMDYGNQMYLFCNERVERPQDLKGLRFRGTPFVEPFYDALGIDSISMPISDVYTALERGLVVGYVWARTGVADMGLAEVTKYMIDAPFWMSGLGVIINLDTWNGLPKDVQDLLTACAIEHEKWVPENYGAFLEEETQKIREAGVEFIKFSPEDYKSFTDLAREAGWAAFAEENPAIAAKTREMFTK